MIITENFITTIFHLVLILAYIVLIGWLTEVLSGDKNDSIFLFDRKIKITLLVMFCGGLAIASWPLVQLLIYRALH